MWNTDGSCCSPIHINILFSLSSLWLVFIKLCFDCLMFLKWPRVKQTNEIHWTQSKWRCIGKNGWLICYGSVCQISVQSTQISLACFQQRDSKEQPTPHMNACWRSNHDFHWSWCLNGPYQAQTKPPGPHALEAGGELAGSACTGQYSGIYTGLHRAQQALETIWTFCQL